MSKVIVYFGTKSHTEHIATFNDEETYGKCIGVLEEYAKECRMELIESVIEEEEDE